LIITFGGGYLQTDLHYVGVGPDGLKSRTASLGLVNHVHSVGVIRIPREEYERVLREGIRKHSPIRHGTR